MSEAPEEKNRRKRIAVIAIHGVGDHEQFTTAREIGDLLSNLEYKPAKDSSNPEARRVNTPRYAPFTEVMKRINVRPVRSHNNGKEGFDWSDDSLQKRTWGPMDALARAVFQGQLKVETSAAADNSPSSLDHQFMKGQLYKYRNNGPEDTYQCLRLEGNRVAPVRKPDERPAAPEADTAAALASRLHASGVALPKTETVPGSPGTEDQTVHIYEMFWADLSKLGNGFTQIFSELYQVLFHLGSVSVNNVLAAAIHFHDRKGGREWRRFCHAQWFSAAVLAWPIPILNMYMAAFVPVVAILSLMRTHLSARGEYIAFIALTAAVLTAFSGQRLSRLRRFPAVLYPAPLLLFGTAAAILCVRPGNELPWSRDTTEEMCALVLLAVTLGIVWLIVRAYDRRRPGSSTAAVWLGAFVAVGLGAAFSVGGIPIGSSAGHPAIAYPAIAMTLNAVEICFGFVGAAWAVFYGSYMWAHVAGWLAVRSVRSDSGGDNREYTDPEYTRALRTRWTSQLVLALSSVAFLLLTLPVWTGVIKVTLNMLPGQAYVADSDLCVDTRAGCRFERSVSAGPCVGVNCPPVQYIPVTALLYRFGWTHGLANVGAGSSQAAFLERQAEEYLHSPPKVSRWANQMLLAGGIVFLPIMLCALLVAILFSAWAIFPSFSDEVKPPDAGSRDATDEERTAAADELRRKSTALGVWLDRGFQLMRWGGKILYWTMWAPPLLFIVVNFALIGWIYEHWQLLDGLTGVVGTLVAGAAVGIFGLTGRIRYLGRAFRPLVRVMLDVDNWLREHPRESNPTARICARYVSLLRHICTWRDTDAGKSPYDALVIVAHSQGTVITADFLRYLNAERNLAGSMAAYDAELALFDKPLPVYFFSMGCPLHQLYGLRFPHLYGWARSDAPDETLEPGTLPDIGKDDAPRPQHLGVERWINAYRSGDYVGRYLWRGGGKGYEWDPTPGSFIHESYKEDWDPPAGKPEKVSADAAGQRIECCIGPGAHTHYWDHTAPLVAEVLDRMINNA
jgi:hypothetical protein